MWDLSKIQKKIDADITKLQSCMERKSKIYYYARESQWKKNRKCTVAYHKAKWGGKDAHDAINYPMK